jgi:oligoribonuclease NrnB/cAMP/cGMP phosphodiesterase (DHH superfamily)
MICIYHSRDLDGLCSAAIVKLKYPEASLIGYDYKQPLPIIADNEDIFMVDISFPIDDMIKLRKRSKSLTWIDHHRSSIKEWRERYEKDTQTKPPAGKLVPCPTIQTITAMTGSNFAACELVWQFIYPEKRIPQVVELLGRYDIHDKNKYDWENIVLPFQYGIRAEWHSISNLIFLITKSLDKKEESEIINGILITGSLILKYVRQEDEKEAKKSFEVEIDGYKAICINRGRFNSDLFRTVIKLEHQIMLDFQYNGKEKLWVFRIFSNSKSIDCSKIAEKYGGGGHKGSAEFKVEEIEEVFRNHPGGKSEVRRQRIFPGESYIIKSEKQGNGFYGTPIQCIKEEGDFPPQEYEKLERAIVAAYSENNPNIEYQIIHFNDGICFIPEKDKPLFARYADYILEDNTIRYVPIRKTIIINQIPDEDRKAMEKYKKEITNSK